jgi:hypothetical protein
MSALERLAGSFTEGATFKKRNVDLILKHGSHNQKTHGGKGGGSGSDGGSDNYREIKDMSERTEFESYQLKDKKFMDTAYREYGSTEKTEAYRALDHYKSYGYGTINHKLRTGEVEPSQKESVAGYIKEMDGAMRVAPGLPESITTFRTIRQGNSSAIDEVFSSLDEGDTWVDKGFSSTTLDRFVMEGIRKGSTDWLVEIKNPAGTKGIMLDALKSKAGFGSWESEWLLPRGSTFEVLNIDTEGRTMTVKVSQ